MALDNINLIITAPNVSPVDAEALFGDTEMSIVGSCLSPKINQWSRYKPIHYAGVTGLNFKLRNIGYQNNRHGLKAKSYASWTDLVNNIMSGQNLATITDWTYNRALLKSPLVPKRISDLDGYYHNAAPPFAGFFCPATLGNATAGSQQEAYLLPALTSDVGADSPTSPGSIGINQIESPEQGALIPKTLDKFYFGVALINKGSSPEVKWALSENAPVDANGNITHNYKVAMALNEDFAAGTYYAVPVLTRAKVTGMTTNPQQICLVPNCFPLEITVTSSAVENEDIEVIITSCTYIPSLDDATTGIVRTVVRVKSKAAYDKNNCEYTAYTVANNSTTQTEFQDGNFNLPANTEYPFTCSVTMTAAAASATMIRVVVKALRLHGAVQTVSATRAPLVPDI